MEIVTIYTARNGPEAQMICGTLQEVGINALAPTNLSPWGGAPVLTFFPIRVPKRQVEFAKGALRDLGLEPEES